MIRLRAMTEAEFARFRALDRETYAQSVVHAHKIPHEEARQEAARLDDDILKDGLRTPGHEILTAVLDATGAAAGYLWCEVE
jgi:hypothetical protein